MSRSVPICVVGVPDGALDRSPLAGGRSLNPRPVDADTTRPGRSHSPTSTGSPGSAYRADLRAARVRGEGRMMMTPLHSRWGAVARPHGLMPRRAERWVGKGGRTTGKNWWYPVH